MRRRRQGQHLEIISGRQAIFSGDVPADFTDILIQRRADRMRIDIACDTWTPAVDIGNGDERVLGIQLHSIAFYRRPNPFGASRSPWCA